MTRHLDVYGATLVTEESACRERMLTLLKGDVGQAHREGITYILQRLDRPEWDVTPKGKKK